MAGGTTTWSGGRGTAAGCPRSAWAGPTAHLRDRSTRAGRREAGGATHRDAGPRLALTFDMGGRLVPAVSIMRYLLLNGVCSTIFATGVAAGTPTGQAVLEMVSQYPELFEVGNHTMNHCDLVRGGGAAACPNRRPTDGRLRRELTDAAAVIEPLAGQSPVPYWRPPFGSYDTAVLIAAASVSYTKTILWDIDTIDWRPISQGGPTADQIAAKVVAAPERERRAQPSGRLPNAIGTARRDIRTAPYARHGADQHLGPPGPAVGRPLWAQVRAIRPRTSSPRTSSPPASLSDAVAGCGA